MHRALQEPGTELVKWGASLAQIAGYTATASGLEPWNIVFFLIGIVGWFVVGLRWHDRAIILTHIVALSAMLAGLMKA